MYDSRLHAHRRISYIIFVSYITKFRVNQYFDMIGWFGLDYKPLKMLWSVPQGFFFPEKMTSLEIVDMSFIF